MQAMPRRRLQVVQAAMTMSIHVKQPLTTPGASVELLPIAQAAAELGVSRATLYRWFAQGCPRARRNAHPVMVDIEAVRAWRTRPQTILTRFANDLPDIVGNAALAEFLDCDGPHKRSVAGLLAVIATRATVDLLARLRVDVPETPELQRLPRSVSRLRDSGRG